MSDVGKPSSSISRCINLFTIPKFRHPRAYTNQKIWLAIFDESAALVINEDSAHKGITFRIENLFGCVKVLKTTFSPPCALQECHIHIHSNCILASIVPGRKRHPRNKDTSLL